MIFVAVNTPTKTYGEGKGMAADLTYVEKVLKQLQNILIQIKLLSKNPHYQLELLRK